MTFQDFYKTYHVFNRGEKYGDKKYPLNECLYSSDNLEEIRNWKKGKIFKPHSIIVTRTPMIRGGFDYFIEDL